MALALDCDFRKTLLNFLFSVKLLTLLFDILECCLLCEALNLSVRSASSLTVVSKFFCKIYNGSESQILLQPLLSL